MRRALNVWVVVCVLLVAGCDKSHLMRSFGSPADEKVAVHYIELLRNHDYAPIEQDIDPSLRSSDLHEKMLAIGALVPTQAPLSVKLVGVNTFEGGALHRSNYTYEYEYADRWLLINTAVQKKDGVSTIVGFNVRRLSDSLESTNRFSLAGRNALQYAVLAAAVLVPLLCLYALVRCVRTPMPRRKWLWILFILFGVCTVSVNWTSGQWSFQPVSFLLFGASATRPFYGPWVLAVAFPLGAVWFLIKRKSYLLRASQAPLPPALPTSEKLAGPE